MTVEELTKKIYNECLRDGEKVTMEEAKEMAEMELKSNDLIKNYTISEEQAKKKEKKTHIYVASDEKKEIFADIINALSEKYDISTEIKDKKAKIHYNGKTFTVDLVQNRDKKR